MPGQQSELRLEPARREQQAEPGMPKPKNQKKERQLHKSRREKPSAIATMGTACAAFAGEALGGCEAWAFFETKRPPAPLGARFGCQKRAVNDLKTQLQPTNLCSCARRSLVALGLVCALREERADLMRELAAPFFSG